MDILYSFQDNILRQVTNEYRRYIYDRIDWDQRMLAIKGPRGAGKTTLMLQRIRYDIDNRNSQTLYISLDHHWFYTNNLIETTDSFVKNGGVNLFIDEVHKYPNWSRELKNIYDGFPNLKIVISSSSALDLYRGEADLSRRLITYNLPGMSFREYLQMFGLGIFSTVSLDDILNNHRALSLEVCRNIRPLLHFKNYLKYGYFPFFSQDSDNSYLIKLGQIVNTVVESDLSTIEKYSASTAHKIKKLLGVLSESVPFKPNIASLARKIDVSRDSIYDWLIHLEKACLINLLTAEGSGSSLLRKPEKIYLENTNLAYALKPMPDVGNLRETFLMNQLKNSGLKATTANHGDFHVAGNYIEVGGKNKTNSQIKNISNAYVAADDIESGYGKKIPLWLFGFLY